MEEKPLFRVLNNLLRAFKQCLPKFSGMKKVKLSYCVLGYIILAYLNSFIANNISLPEGVTPKLFDVGHYLFPEISTFYPDILFFSLLLYFIFRWRNHHDLLKAFFLICSSLFLIRLLTFPVTQIPPAFNEADCFKPSADGPWIFFTFYSSSTCVDYMFSAHTFHLTVISLITLYNSKNYFVASSLNRKLSKKFNWCWIWNYNVALS